MAEVTKTAEIVERLRKQHLHHCFQIDREAADHMESLARERDRAVEALDEIAEYPSSQPIALNIPDDRWQARRAQDMQRIAWRALNPAEIDTESEGEG